MRRSSTDETPYRRSPSLDSKPDTPPFTSGFHRFSGEFEYKRPPFAFGFHTTKGPQTSKGRYAQGKKYVVFYLDLSFIFLLELRRCRMAEGCMMALRYGMVFFNLLFWVSPFRRLPSSECLVCALLTCYCCSPVLLRAPCCVLRRRQIVHLDHVYKAPAWVRPALFLHYTALFAVFSFGIFTAGVVRVPYLISLYRHGSPLKPLPCLADHI